MSHKSRLAGFIIDCEGGSLAAASTFSNARPQRQIDHILGSPEVQVVASGAESLSFSDHRLLWADQSL